MKNKLLLLALLAALLTACAPNAGTRVQTKSAAFGCKTWYEAALAWTDCHERGNEAGVVEDHPTVGHEYNGRIRVQLNSGQVLWFEPRDLVTP